MLEARKFECLAQELLGGPKYELACVLSDPVLERDRGVAGTEQVARLVTIFGSSTAESLMQYAITKEVEETQFADTLFRANSFTTRLSTCIFRNVGPEYLRFTVLPSVTKISTEAITSVRCLLPLSLPVAVWHLLSQPCTEARFARSGKESGDSNLHVS